MGQPGAADFDDLFDGMERMCRSVAERLVADPDAAVSSARDRFLAMAPDLAYADRPEHPMASSLFYCAAQLSLYLTLKGEGVDVHAFGGAMLDALRTALAGVVARREARGEAQAVPDPGMLENLRRAAERSQTDARPGEFVFEVLGDDADPGRRSMDITACGICYLYGRHDALELVPYMCATDDLTSDAAGEGLRRTGTIALGSRCCDFRFDSSRPGQHISELHPDRIRTRPVS